MSPIRPTHAADITTTNSPTFLVLDAMPDEVPNAVSDGVLDELLDGKKPCDFVL
jgi:hypothetical protein